MQFALVLADSTLLASSTINSLLLQAAMENIDALAMSILST